MLRQGYDQKGELHRVRKRDRSHMRMHRLACTAFGYLALSQAASIPP